MDSTEAALNDCSQKNASGAQVARGPRTGSLGHRDAGRGPVPEAWVTSPSRSPPPRTPHPGFRQGRRLKVSLRFVVGSRWGWRPLGVTLVCGGGSQRGQRGKAASIDAHPQASPRLRWWSPDAGSFHPVTPGLAITHPAVASDSERARAAAARWLWGRARMGRGVQVRRAAPESVAKGSGTRGRKSPTWVTKAPPPTWPRPAVSLEAILHRHVTRALAPPVCSHSLSPAPSSRGPRDPPRASHVRRGFWVGGGWLRGPEWQ